MPCPMLIDLLFMLQEGRFLIGKWIREAFLYLLFLVAFTYTQLMGECLYFFFGRACSRLDLTKSIAARC